MPEEAKKSFYDEYREAAMKMDAMMKSDPEKAGLADRLYQVEYAYQECKQDLDAVVAENERIRDGVITKTNAKVLLEVLGIDVIMPTKECDKLVRALGAIIDDRSNKYKREIEELKNEVSRLKGEEEIFTMAPEIATASATVTMENKPTLGAFGETKDAQ